MTVAKVIEQWQNSPFEYGATDCCQFVGHCVATFRGRNLVDEIKYTNEAEALAIVAEHGLEHLVTSVIGDPVDRDPHDNDVVLVNDGTQDILGFIWNSRIILRTPKGLVDWPLERAEVVWAP